MNRKSHRGQYECISTIGNCRKRNRIKAKCEQLLNTNFHLSIDFDCVFYDFDVEIDSNYI